MEKDVLFSEKQKFKQWWLWLILLGLNGLFLYRVFRHFISGQSLGNSPMFDFGLVVVNGLTILLTLLFVSLRLETSIKNDGIYVRFFPFHLQFKHYPWHSLTKVYLRQYAPITEYGGWGLRIGNSSKGTAYNVAGNQGLQLEFSDGKKVLIGTNKAEELAETLRNIGQLKP